VSVDGRVSCGAYGRVSSVSHNIPGEEEVDRHKEALLDTCVSSGGRVVEIDQPPVSGLLVGRVVDLRVQTEPVGRDLVDLLTSDLEFDLVRWEMGETSER